MEMIKRMRKVHWQIFGILSILFVLLVVQIVWPTTTLGVILVIIGFFLLLGGMAGPG